MTDPDERLDTLLATAAPSTTPLSEELTAELVRISTTAREQALERTKLRGGRRLLTVGLISLAVLGGAGAAAAVTVDTWAWWKDVPPAPFRYVLPSGVTCETEIVGNIHGPTPESSAAAADFLRRVDIAGVLDVDRELRELRERGDDRPAAGTTVMAGSQPLYFMEDTVLTEDQQYRIAVINAVIPAVVSELQSEGFQVEPGQFSWQHETTCEESEW